MARGSVLEKRLWMMMMMMVMMVMMMMRRGRRTRGTSSGTFAFGRLDSRIRRRNTFGRRQMMMPKELITVFSHFSSPDGISLGNSATGVVDREHRTSTNRYHFLFAC